MLVMAVNAGSSSLKYKLYKMPEEEVLCGGLAERIGHDDAIFKIKFGGNEDKQVLPIPDHKEAVRLLIEALKGHGIIKNLEDIEVVSHRVVQGGPYYSHSVVFDDSAEEKIKELIPLDPLHAPAHLIGYHAFKEYLPHALATAVFDTAYHQTMEKEDYLFPIPLEYAEKFKCRRFGAHGTSHQYLIEKAIRDYFGGKAEGTKIICCHLGSGASLTAAKNGKCVATSMGLTPLGGIMMGTRCGDIDPSVCNYLADCLKVDSDAVYDILNKKSGLLGISGVSNDSRDVEEADWAGNENAHLASKLFARRTADFIGQYFVRLGGVDLIIFSAGIGENSSYFRKLILEDILEALGLDIDEKKNEAYIRGKEGLISTPGSKVRVAVIPTDEEVMLARDGYKIKEGKL